MLAPFAFNFNFEFPCQKLAKKLDSFGHEEKFRKLKNPTTVHCACSYANVRSSWSELSAFKTEDFTNCFLSFSKPS